ncbi:MAG: NAD-dependent epimerase/dehydratase family protein [Limisphaerales bacterium]
MRTLILGLGYVGTALAERFVADGHDVVGIRRGVSDEGEAPPGVEVRHGDIADSSFWAQLDEGFDWVIHCASSSRGGIESYRDVFEKGSRLLARWLGNHPPKRFVFTSSTSVYAQTDGSVVDEGSPAEGAGETGKILRGAEDEFLAACDQSKILRVAGIYGPGRGHLFLKYLADEARLTGDPGRWLNQVHRDDVVGAIQALLPNNAAPPVTIVADDEPVTQSDFFTWLSERLGKSMPPVAEAPTKRKRALTNKRVANTQLRELGYQLRFPTFREGYLDEMKRLALPIL